MKFYKNFVKTFNRCYHASVKDQFIVMEDLVASGYKNADRKYGLDMNHYTKVLTKLAKWHAATAVLKTMVNRDKTNYLNQK